MIALTIAGSDSSGGAGIQADLKTFSALGVYGASAITALTAQNTRGVQGIFEVRPDFVKAQITSVLSDLDVKAIKIGMLSSAAIIHVVAETLKAYSHIPVVLDPVMISASGDRLLALDAVNVLQRTLMTTSLVMTPNLHEAASLLGSSIAKDEAQMCEQGKMLVTLGYKAVLIKGGHSDSANSADFLVTETETMRFSAPRIATSNSHGTGCTLASAITAGLAKGLTLQEAVQKAKTYLTAALAASSHLHIGGGSGPVHHFYDIW